jgi:Ala-tRNA(Pro) deacylase
MHPGLITCSLETPLRKVAELMAAYRIHAVVTLGEGQYESALWGVVSDLDLARAALADDFDDRTAGGVASTPVATIADDATVDTAVASMARHGVAHVIVVDRETDRPLGVLSTLDVARAAARSTWRSRLARSVVARELADARVEHDVLRHPTTMTAREEAAALGIRPQEVAKTVVLRTGDGYVRAVIPASERLDVRKLRERLGDDVRLATEPELVWAYPQFELGAVPPFGGPAGDRVVVDPRLAAYERLVFEAGSHDESVRVRTEDLLELADAEFIEMCVD